MKFRNQKEPAAAQEAEFEIQPTPLEPGRERWSTAFLVAGSALLGATALALWNRRMIASMRAQIQDQTPPNASASSADEEIF